MGILTRPFLLLAWFFLQPKSENKSIFLQKSHFLYIFLLTCNFYVDTNKTDIHITPKKEEAIPNYGGFGPKGYVLKDEGLCKEAGPC